MTGTAVIDNRMHSHMQPWAGARSPNLPIMGIRAPRAKQRGTTSKVDGFIGLVRRRSRSPHFVGQPAEVTI